MLNTNCKYCGIELFSSRKPRTTGSCRKCRHKEYKLTPEERAERYKQWKINNPSYKSNWAKNNPEKNRVKSARTNRSLAGQYNHGIYRAKRAGIQHTITKEQYSFLRVMPCDYCGGKLDPTGHALDRKESCGGYTIDNVVPACGQCNRIKKEFWSHDEMKAAMSAVMEVRRQYPILRLISDRENIAS